MIASQALYWSDALGRNILSPKGVTALLSAFGVLWLLVEPTNFFFDGIGTAVKPYWWVFLGLGLVYAVWTCRPFVSTACKLDGRDIAIEVRVGNVFDAKGVLVVGTNTTFDTKISTNLISEASIQGQFTRKFFASEQALDLCLADGLKGLPFDTLTGQRIGKSDRYPVGTTVLVEAKGIRSFWVAVAHINEHGTAVTTSDDLQEALAKLWVRVGEMGTTESVVIPALASRFGQLTLSREAIVRLIIQSFLAACAERTFCERLVIVLSGDDVAKHKINLEELGGYLRYSCRYAALSPSRTPPVGTVVG